jgi:hypothetical protein
LEGQEERTYQNLFGRALSAALRQITQTVEPTFKTYFVIADAPLRIHHHASSISHLLE